MNKKYSVIKKMNREFSYIKNSIVKAEKMALKEANINVTHRELEYIVLIKDNEGHKLNSALNEIAVSKSTWSNQVKLLVTKGFIKLKRSEKDKRVKTPTLTKKGLEAYDIHKQIRMFILNKYKDTVTVKELEVLERISSKIREKIDEKK